MGFVISDDVMRTPPLLCHLSHQVLITVISDTKCVESHLVCTPCKLKKIFFFPVNKSISEQENSFVAVFFPLNAVRYVDRFSDWIHDICRAHISM